MERALLVGPHFCNRKVQKLGPKIRQMHPYATAGMEGEPGVGQRKPTCSPGATSESLSRTPGTEGPGRKDHPWGATAMDACTSDLEEETAWVKPCGPANVATCTQVATEGPERKSPLPESKTGEPRTETPSRETCLSTCPDTEHKRTGGGPTSPSWPQYPGPCTTGE